MKGWAGGQALLRAIGGTRMRTCLRPRVIASARGRGRSTLSRASSTARSLATRSVSFSPRRSCATLSPSVAVALCLGPYLSLSLTAPGALCVLPAHESLHAVCNVHCFSVSVQLPVTSSLSLLPGTVCHRARWTWHSARRSFSRVRRACTSRCKLCTSSTCARSDSFPVTRSMLASSPTSIMLSTVPNFFLFRSQTSRTHHF